MFGDHVHNSNALYCSFPVQKTNYLFKSDNKMAIMEKNKNNCVITLTISNKFDINHLQIVGLNIGRLFPRFLCGWPPVAVGGIGGIAFFSLVCSHFHVQLSDCLCKSLFQFFSRVLDVIYSWYGAADY